MRLVETTTSETYPKVESDAAQQVEFLPVSLKEFLHGILAEDDNVKLASIGQTPMQAARPRMFFFVFFFCKDSFLINIHTLLE